MQHRKNKPKIAVRLSLTALFALYLTNCATRPTPATRIAEQPELYESLSSEHKRLVSQGQIIQGMPKSAVSLAWGEASHQRTGERDGRAFTEWIYMGSRAQPIQQTGFFIDPYWGGPWGPWGAGFHPGWGGGWGGWGGNAFMWVPEERARVTFVNNKVNSWITRNDRP